MVIQVHFFYVFALCIRIQDPHQYDPEKVNKM
jgi:hypothetical protein